MILEKFHLPYIIFQKIFWSIHTWDMTIILITSFRFSYDVFACQVLSFEKIHKIHKTQTDGTKYRNPT